MDKLQQDTSGAPGVLPADARIFVAGHRGMVGSAILRRLRAEGCRNLVTRCHAELELTEQQAVRDFFQNEKIDVVVLAAARVGGIHANHRLPAEFIYQNLMIEANVIHAAYRQGIQRLLFLGSSCIYPRHAPQPIKETHLLTGPLEPTNEAYAVAKIAGIKLCEFYNRQYGTRYRSVMPTNLYGPHDNFDLETSHVMPAMMRKCHLAKLAMGREWEKIKRDEDCFGPIPAQIRADLEALASSGEPPAPAGVAGVRLWGSGQVRREFLHVDDMAAACVFVMKLSDSQYEAMIGQPSAREDTPAKPRTIFSHINVGAGKDLQLRELADIIKNVVGYDGPVIWDRSRPEGTPRKLLDVSRLNKLGWQPGIALTDGIKDTYHWYLARTESTAARAANKNE